MNLRFFLVCIFFVLALVPLLLFRAWPYAQVLGRTVQDAQERHLIVAEMVAHALSGYHSALEELFDVEVEALAAQSGQGRAKGAEAARMARLGMRHVCLVDLTNGTMRAGVNNVVPGCEELAADGALVRLANLAGEETGFAPAVASALGGNVVQILRRRGDVLAVGTVDTRAVAEFGQTIRFGKGGHAVIVDQAGQVLFHPQATRAALREPLAGEPVVARLMAGEAGIGVVHLHDDPAGELVGGFAPVEGPGWGVMVLQPATELYATAAAARRAALTVMLIGIGAALALAYLISVVTSRPLEQMRVQTRQVADGRLDVSGLLPLSPVLPLEFRRLQTDFRDMIERLRDSILKSTKLAFLDAVTEVPNRLFFRQYVTDWLTQRSDQEFTILFIDLDGFKAVNDTLGHDMGDKVLIEVAQRLSQVMGVNDYKKAIFEMVAGRLSFSQNDKPLIARLGGDEFVIASRGADLKKVKVLAGQVLAALCNPFLIDGHKVTIGGSIGVARYPADAQDYTTLLKSADMAMYRAKEAGKSRVEIFHASIAAQALEKEAMATEFREGLERGEVLPYFQSQYATEDLSLVGVEALVRWEHPIRGLLEPQDFFDIAQETGLFWKIDKMMLEKSVDYVRELAKKGVEVPRLSVNVSTARLDDPALLASVKEMMPFPCEVNFELLESTFLDRVSDRMAWTIEQLDSLGIAFHLDDFGSGHASILALLHLRPKDLKIDKHLLRDFTTDPDRYAVVKAICEMGNSLGIRICAEGVATLEQVEALRDLNCFAVQGFGLAKPLPGLSYHPFCMLSYPKGKKTA